MGWTDEGCRQQVGWISAELPSALDEPARCGEHPVQFILRNELAPHSIFQFWQYCDKHKKDPAALSERLCIVGREEFENAVALYDVMMS